MAGQRPLLASEAGMKDRSVVACDLGGTRLRGAIVGLDGAVRAKRVVPTPAADPEALPRLMRDVLDGTDASVLGAVVGVPGPVDYSTGTAVKLPNLPAWEGRLAAAQLSGEVGVTVMLANDADLAAMGEHRFGAGAGSRR